jgi:hypothetical protein
MTVRYAANGSFYACCVLLPVLMPYAGTSIIIESIKIFGIY